MALDKHGILAATQNGYDVFKYFLGSRFTGLGKAFKSPFYTDENASCYVYLDERSKLYKFKDFGDSEYSGDCFFFVGRVFGLACEHREDFVRILHIIDDTLALNLANSAQKANRLVDRSKGALKKASALDSSFDEFETAQPDLPIQKRPFTAEELDFWAASGITKEILERYHVVAIETFQGKGKSGNNYKLKSTPDHPIFGYEGIRHIKLYMPYGDKKFRFLFSGEKSENYIFGKDQLPLRGELVFITGGEKDVLSLAAHGFPAVSMNSETAQIPKNLLRTLAFRFKHVVLLYDVDETGLKAMENLKAQHKSFDVKSLKLPLSVKRGQKDVTDFFKLGHTANDLRMLFVEMLNTAYEDTMAILGSCEIDFSNPPVEPEPLIQLGSVTVGANGNLLCVTGSEGSGKTNFLGGILSGSIKPRGIEIDTLGTMVKENLTEQAVLLYDTEQSDYQLYKNLTYIVSRSQMHRPPRWFKSYSLVGISRNDRMKLILDSMDRHYYEYGGIHMVVLDGIGDLLAGVNDEEGSVALIEELMRMAAIYDTVVLCVLHMTPSGMKLRGHLGSEVQRKAAGIILIEKDDKTDSSMIKALKVRDGSPFDVPIMEFGWSKEEGRHVFLGEKGPKENMRRKSHDLAELAQSIFAGIHLLSTKELGLKISDHLDVQERRARDYIKQMRELQIIEKSHQFPGSYQLIHPKKP